MNVKGYLIIPRHCFTKQRIPVTNYEFLFEWEIFFKSLYCVLLCVKLLLLRQTTFKTCPIPELTGFQANFYYLNLGEAINKKAPASYIAYIMKFNVFLSGYQHLYTCKSRLSDAIDFLQNEGVGNN